MDNNLKEIEDIIQAFIIKYGQNEYYTRDFREKVISWLDNTDEEDIKNILLELLKDFRFFTKFEIKEILLKQLQNSLEKVNLDCTNIMPVLSKNRRVNSSFELLMLVKEIARENGIEWYSNTIITDSEDIDDDIEYLIMFDDISGTGGTIIKFLDKYRDKVLNREVHINLIAITESAEIAINEYVKKEENCNLHVKIKYEYKYKKAFEEQEKFSDLHRENLYNFEKNIWGDGNDNILGYKDSEILVGFSHNIPNNTISSFWFDSKFKNNKIEWNALFKRFTLKERRPSKERKKQNKEIARRTRKRYGL